MGTISELRHAGSVIRFDQSVIDPMDPRLFDVDWLRANGHHRGSSAGRNQAHFFAFAGRDMVLRNFVRGGLIGKVNRDLFLRTSLHRSRAMQEFELLGWMRARGLAVPEPMAALYAPWGPVYRASIIMGRIARARPLEEALREAAQPVEIWDAVGQAIRRLHDHRVYHSDLNCRNILIDADNRPWIIDFDKCERRAPGAWTRQNLDRLHRSLAKENTKAWGLHWTEDDWATLLAAYGSKPGEESDGAGGRPSL